MDENRLINNIDDLPVMPEIVLKINEILQNTEVNIDEISAIIEKDSALSAKVLRLANSSYYGLVYQVDSISRAIIVLGFNTVCNLITSIGISTIFKEQLKNIGIDLSGLWFHTLGCAVAAKVIISQKNQNDAEKAFICGILHDIGKVIIAKILPEEQNKIFDTLYKTKKTIYEIEEEIISTNHAKIGFSIGEKWKFPEYILDTIRFHHDPLQSKIAPDITSAVHLGNAISKALSLGISTDSRAFINPMVWDQLSINQQKIPSLIKDIQNEFDLAMEFWIET